MITRNCFGKLEPRIGKYVVEKRYDGKWEINKEEYRKQKENYLKHIT